MVEVAGEVRQRKIRRAYGFDEPCSHDRRQNLAAHRIVSLQPRRWRGREWLGQEVTPAFVYFNAMVDGQSVEDFGNAAGPSNCRLDRVLMRSHAEEKLLGVLGQKTRAGLEILCLAKRAGHHGYCGADCVAVALFSAQTEYDGIADAIHRESQNAD